MKPKTIEFACGCVATRIDAEGIAWSLEHCLTGFHADRFELLQWREKYAKGRSFDDIEYTTAHHTKTEE